MHIDATQPDNQASMTNKSILYELKKVELLERRNCIINISLVVPVYNEFEAIDYFVEEIESILGSLEKVEIEIVFVNDGSKDDTLEKILSLPRKKCTLTIVELTRNFGKEAALSAGLQIAKGHVVIPIDVDLQDPPALIPIMIAKWREGYDVVLAKRSNRDTDTWLKRKSAGWFYSIHNIISDLKLHSNVGDYRLLDRKIVDILNQLPENNRFMKGLYAWVGCTPAIIEYTRMKRSAGHSKFNGWRLWNLALEAITSFSTAPLRIWTYIGLIVAICSIIFAVIIALKVIIYGVEVNGYASLIVAVTMIGGIQLIGIGILGEYLGRVYMESKRRPIYVIKHTYHLEKESKITEFV